MVRGERGQVRMHMELTIRLDYGLPVPATALDARLLLIPVRLPAGNWEAFPRRSRTSGSSTPR